MRKSRSARSARRSHRADRGDHPALRRLHRGRAGQDLPQRGVRLHADHRRAAASSSLGGHRSRRSTPPSRSRSSVRSCNRSCANGSSSTWARSRVVTAKWLSGSGPDLARLRLPGVVEKAVYGALAVRDEHAPALTDRKGNPEPDPDLRDNENVPSPAIALSFVPDPTDRLSRLEFRSAVNDYMNAEVLPYAPDAWVDVGKTKVGFEIPLTRYFYRFIPPRPLK